MTSSDFSHHIASVFPNGYTSTTLYQLLSFQDSALEMMRDLPALILRLSYHVAVPTPVDSIGAHGYFFPIDTSLHHVATDSTSTYFHPSAIEDGYSYDAATFALCYNLISCSHLAQVLLLQSFHSCSCLQ